MCTGKPKTLCDSFYCDVCITVVVWSQTYIFDNISLTISLTNPCGIITTTPTLQYEGTNGSNIESSLNLNSIMPFSFFLVHATQYVG